MADWVQQNWIWIAVALVVLVLLVWLLRRGGGGDVAAPQIDMAPKAPLVPNKPEIAPAERVDFAATPPPAAMAAPPPPPPAEAMPNIAAAVGDPDNLQLIKGVGPKLAALLAALGVTRFDQIAAWTDADVAEVDPHLGAFQGRIGRDNWIDQAAYLARGDTAGFEGKYGALGSEIK